MEIFRHYYPASEFATSNFFKQHMNTFGFCKLDGTRIDYNYDTHSQSNMRYRLDGKKQTYLSYNWWTGNNSNTYYSLTDLGIHLSNGETYYAGKRTGDHYGNGISPATVVFIPLKNNGFLLNYRAIQERNYNENNPSIYSNDDRDKTYLINTATPSLNIKIYDTGGEPNAPYYGGRTGVTTFIGLPPCKGNSNWTYLLYTSGSWNNGSKDNRYTYIDFGDSRVLDMPFRSEFVRELNQYPAYNEPTYSDINNNICSMIKLPYDNNYIDGLYLLSTAPQQLEDATFFSFDGRNFLNIFDNYVVELPSSN